MHLHQPPTGFSFAVQQSEAGLNLLGTHFQSSFAAAVMLSAPSVSMMVGYQAESAPEERSRTRRSRTAFTDEQLQELEKYYSFIQC